MKIWLFRITAVAIPLLFFVFLEIGLRVAGFGQSHPVFIKNPANPNYLLPYPDLVKRYFAFSDFPPKVSVEANFFLKHKPQDGLRIFVQGGSSAAGFPYGLGASLAGMLDNRLKRTFPGHTVEVVNTALAAVNSYTLLDIADEIIQQAPDAVLIYAGHNEYLGIMGVGSNYTAAGSQATALLFLKLKHLRIFQLIQWLYQSTQSLASIEEKEPNNRTFMAKVAKHKNIPIDSDIYRAGLQQFETNLGLLLDKYQRAGVPVYIATLTSNLRDHAPFASLDMDAKHQSLLTELSSSPTQALVEEAVALSNTTENADFAFQLGRLLLQLNQAELAKQQLLSAKDWDLLRFRAPESFNQVIRQTAQKYNANLVNAAERFVHRSPQGIVGNNLMLEHLHPNVQGYFLLSDAFYQSLKQRQKWTEFSGKWHDVSTNEAWTLRPILPAEEYYGYAKVRQLMSDYPFVEQPIALKLQAPADWQQQLGAAWFEQKTDWISMMQAHLQQFKKANNVEMERKASQLLADALPHDPIINHQAGDLLHKNKQIGLAVHYYKRAVKAGEISPSLYRKIMRGYVSLGMKDKALVWKNKLSSD